MRKRTKAPSRSCQKDPRLSVCRASIAAALQALTVTHVLAIGTVFTPDSTHYPIAKLALESGHHVMVTKPATQLLEHHQELAKIAADKGLVCWVEQYVYTLNDYQTPHQLNTRYECGSHKRYDPVYSSAHQQSKNIGDFSYWYSYMSQPKSQLQTFAAWAGIDSDISMYLNSHHVRQSF